AATEAASDATPVTPAPTEVPAGSEGIYVVQPGDNLYRIGLRFNLVPSVLAAYNGIYNENFIYVGQVLRIPPSALSNGPVVVATAAPTTAPSETEMEATAEVEATAQVEAATAVVKEATEEPVVSIVTEEAVTATPLPTATLAPTLTPMPTATTVPTATVLPEMEPTLTLAPEEPTLPPSPARAVGFAYGVVADLQDQDVPVVVDRAVELETTWVKQEISWERYAPDADTIDWDALDAIVDALDEANLNILLTVTDAPDWARDTTEEQGPPANYDDLAAFVGALAERYAGRVGAYEIWSEPNLRREWNTPLGISASSYVEMLRLAYTAIRTADPKAIVVTGGLAPTGYNDGVNAISDRVYLRQLYQAGVADWSDAIGAHPMGWANPPDSACCQQNRPEIDGWDEDPSFFFSDTLQDYREIMVQNGDSGTYLWVTKFGWGTNDGLNVEPPQGFEFVGFTSLDEQTTYSIRAFQLGRELGYIGPMFLWNLNYCQVQGVIGVDCLWSLLDPAGNPRPAFLGVRDMAK
uniref:LysM peptidoglycan-binding domain-containing protein n=1 Tax=Aggregatilinea sp. TaxID=2806333 RepID=UPI002D07CA79